MKRESPLPSIVLILTLALCSASGAAARLANVAAHDESSAVAPPGISRTTWHWRSTVGPGSLRSTPDDPRRYRVVLQPDGRVLVQADCNAVEGRYAMVRGRLGIQIDPSTLVTCDAGSLGGEFLKDLRSASTWSTRGGDLYVRGAAARMRFTQ